MVHCLGVPMGALAAFWLLYHAVSRGGLPLVSSIAIYAVGLVGMLVASAFYQITAPGRRKELLRRIDRAMIFVMIAGTYTPISVNVLYGRGGITLCLILWIMAAIGVFLTLRFPRRFERVSFGLYMAMGWMLVVLMHYCFVLLSPLVIALIVAGGLAYTIGAIIHALERFKFHNPVWHLLVLIAASLQYAAISLQLTGGLF